MSDQYQTDVLVWSEHQAELLRRMGAGERVNDAVDWENIAEEIESLGRSELRACESHLLLALLQDLKADAWPLSRQVPLWRAEVRLHRTEARWTFTRGMRERIDLAKIYASALDALPETIDGQPPLPILDTCLVTLDELLAEPD